jgi:hypothetical protein
MSYVDCPGCGRKVLSVATRCPSCGRAAEARPFEYSSKPKRPWLVPLGLVLTVAFMATVGMLLDQANRERWKPAPAAAPATDTLPPAPAESPVAEAPDTVPPADSVAVPVPARAVERPVAERPEPRRPTLPVARARMAGSTHRANSWVNLRANRSSSSEVVRVLGPGEPVSADSLVQGWYRVIASGGVVGYVDYRFLDEAGDPQGTP